jgi:hypothetical protein
MCNLNWTWIPGRCLCLKPKFLKYGLFTFFTFTTSTGRTKSPVQNTSSQDSSTTVFFSVREKASVRYYCIQVLNSWIYPKIPFFYSIILFFSFFFFRGNYRISVPLVCRKRPLNGGIFWMRQQNHVTAGRPEMCIFSFVIILSRNKNQSINQSIFSNFTTSLIIVALCLFQIQLHIL